MPCGANVQVHGRCSVRLQSRLHREVCLLKRPLRVWDTVTKPCREFALKFSEATCDNLMGLFVEINGKKLTLKWLSQSEWGSMNVDVLAV